MGTVDIQAIYAKDASLKRDEVQTILDWVNKQPHLPTIDEMQVILFFQSCYYSNEKTKATIDHYFTVKTICPEIFMDRNPANSPLKEALNVTLFTPLAKRTPEGYTIIFIKLMDANPDVYHFATQLKYFDMSTISWLYENGTSKGHLIVLDMEGLVFGHLTKLGPLTMKKFLYYLQEAMPLRLKGLHYFNTVSFMDKILALMKPFMKKELMDMLHLHKNLDGLLEFVPKNCLPEDYGGEMESTKILHQKTIQRMKDGADFFNYENAQKVDESKRPGKPKNAGDYFGIEGTFKKLDLD